MLAYTLEQAEGDLKRAYWYIRAKRRHTTNWEAVNQVRVITAAMRRMGITEPEIKAAMYCLKQRNCRRCNWAADVSNIPCFRIGDRRKAGIPWE